MNKNDVLSQNVIQDLLQDKSCSIEIFKTIDSTNNYGKEFLKSNKIDKPHLILAESQTSGRGRLGRSFYSPEGKGVYMTLISPKSYSVISSSLITISVGIAICRSIKKLTGFSPQIKWVNDIFINGKKIGGILVEATTDFETGEVKNLVMGIGVNFYTGSFPEELKNIVDSLFNNERSNLNNITRNHLISSILNELALLEEITEETVPELIEEYKGYSNVLGKEVTVRIGNEEPFLANAVDINIKGNLIVQKLETQEMITLSFGEVSVRF